MGKEIWKDVVGYEGCYKVSSLGRVKSFHYDKQKGRMLKPGISMGYYFVVLAKDGKKTSTKIHAIMQGDYTSKDYKWMQDFRGNSQVLPSLVKSLPPPTHSQIGFKDLCFHFRVPLLGSV